MIHAPRIAILTAEWFEESELLYPQYRLLGSGCEAKIFTPGGKQPKGKGGLGSILVDGDAQMINANDFDGFIIPGGFAPDMLRRSPEILELVREADALGKPLGFICHGLWVALSAGILAGRRVTAVPVIRPEIEAVGSIWSDQRVVVDENLVTAQVPVDLEPWMKNFLTTVNNSAFVARKA